MLSPTLEIHPVYGAVPREGDFVQPGEVLGLSVDGGEVVCAPIAGRVRLIVSGDPPHASLAVRIVPEPASDAHEAFTRP